MKIQTIQLKMKMKKKIFLDAKRKKEPTPPTARKNNYPILLERRKEGGREGGACFPFLWLWSLTVEGGIDQEIH